MCLRLDLIMADRIRSGAGCQASAANITAMVEAKVHGVSKGTVGS
jgi:hypothetical protein